MHRKRYFIGLPAPAETVDAMLDVCRKSGLSLTWANPRDSHVTLSYLGELPDEAVEKLQYGLEHVYMQPFSVKVDKISTFLSGTTGQSIVSAHVNYSVNMQNLRDQINLCVEAIISKRASLFEYTPHITLARADASMQEELSKKIGVVAEVKSEWAWNSNEFCLYKTNEANHPYGAYGVMRSYPLLAN